jgi:hypothetical protein
LGNLPAMSNEIPRPGSRSVLRSKWLRMTSITTITSVLAFGGFAAASGVTAQAASAPAKYKSTVKFTGTKKGKPSLKVTVSDKVKGGRKITRVAITLPKGFTFNKKTTRGHVKVIGKRFSGGVHGRTLTIDPRNPDASLTIEINHKAIKESKKARAAKAGKVKLKVTEKKPAKKGGGGGKTGASACGTTSTTTAGDLDNTLTTLITDLQGLGSSDPGLGGLLGNTVTNLGQTVCSLGSGINGVGSGSAGSGAQTDLQSALADVQTALTDLGKQNTSGAESEFQKAATEFQDALTAGGSSLSTEAQSALTELEGYFATFTNTLEGLGTGSGSNPAGALTGALTSLESELSGSNPLSGLLGTLLGTVDSTVTGLLGDLTSSFGNTAAGSDFQAAATELNAAVADLEASNTSGAETAFQKAGADIEGAIQALGSGSSASSLLAQLESELTSLQSMS